jgi:5-methylcytosine-specific restriction endonuclease McrA
VVLTVAHLDHQPENCDPDNLMAMCQRCHNAYDAPMRRAGIKARQKAAMARGDLLEGET